MSARVIPDRDGLVARAVEMRLAGAPFRLIGQSLGVSPMSVWHWCRAHINEGGPHAEALRAVEVGRLDRQIEALAARRTELATTTTGGTT